MGRLDGNALALSRGLAVQFARRGIRVNALCPGDESSYINGATFLVDGGVTAAYVTPE